MDRLVTFKINSPAESFALQRMLINEGVVWGYDNPTTPQFPEVPYIIVWPNINTGQLYFSIAHEFEISRYKEAAKFDAGDYLTRNFNVKPSFMDKVKAARWNITHSRLYHTIRYPDRYDILRLIKWCSLELLGFVIFFTFLHFVGGLELSIRMIILLSVGWAIGTSIRPVFRFARNKLLDRGWIS